MSRPGEAAALSIHPPPPPHCLGQGRTRVETRKGTRAGRKEKRRGECEPKQTVFRYRRTHLTLPWDRLIGSYSGQQKFRRTVRGNSHRGAVQHDFSLANDGYSRDLGRVKGVVLLPLRAPTEFPKSGDFFVSNLSSYDSRSLEGHVKKLSNTFQNGSNRKLWW